MSKSVRKTPIAGVVPVASESADKRRANKTTRRLAKTSLRSSEDARLMPIKREVIDPWNMAKEGKFRFDPNSDRKRMRK